MHVYALCIWGEIMVRKVITAILFACALLISVAQQTYADSIYTDGNISNTYTTIFEDIIMSESITKDYVYFRSGQNDYTLVTGDLKFEGGTFSNVGKYKRYTISNSGNNYSNTRYKYVVTSHDGSSTFNLPVSDYLVYSNLGNFPTLVERGSTYELSTIILAIVFGICALIRPILQFTTRFRNGTI